MAMRTIALAIALGTGGIAALAQSQIGPTGYLKPGAFNILEVLPQAPQLGDARDTADRAIFKATRQAVGTPRWALATNDVKLTPTDMARNFSCAAGVALTPANAPHVVAFITRASIDTSRSSGIAKNFFKRDRPYLKDSGPTCQAPAELKGSYDYPSGHTTYGWTWATLLAEIEPDRASPILARGRAYGESRVVCGAHNQSAVDDGFLTASATIAAMANDPAFLADREAARAELAALRASPATPKPDAAACSAEAALIAQRIY